MIGVILAAGMAKRLRPLTDTQPKCLLKVGERTLLERTVDAMTGAGIQELVVVTGYRGEMIRQFLTCHHNGGNTQLAGAFQHVGIGLVANDYSHTSHVATGKMADKVLAV